MESVTEQVGTVPACCVWVKQQTAIYFFYLSVGACRIVHVGWLCRYTVPVFWDV